MKLAIILRWLAPMALLRCSMWDSDTPDTSKQDANAAKITDLTEEQWNWVKQKYEESAPDRKAASDRANLVSDAQLRGMNLQNRLTEESANDYRTIYRPLEQQAAQEATDYNSEAKRQELAGKAKADVEQSFADAQQIANRNMTRTGVNPGDPAYASATAGLQRDHALALTFGANKARTDAETLGRALRSDVIGTGRGVIGSQGTTAGLAINAGNSSVGNAGVPLSVANQGIGIMSQGAQAATAGYGAAGNIYANSAKTQVDANNNSGLGALVGGAAMVYGMSRPRIPL